MYRIVSYCTVPYRGLQHAECRMYCTVYEEVELPIVGILLVDGKADDAIDICERKCLLPLYGG